MKKETIQKHSIHRIELYVVLAVFLLSLISCDSSPKISGAGATFPAPYYNLVFKKYTEKTGNKVTYGAIGSGGGIRSLKDKTVNFGATDVYISDKELKKIKEPIIHIPTALGAVVISYNLPEIEELKLNSDVISKIYRGEISKWDDNAIKAINPNIKLPNKTITPIYRSDGSGTTSVFSEYMSKTDSIWKKELGHNKSIKFQHGIAAKGNPGVAGIIKETEGSMGYIGSEYTLALNLPMALIQNSSGKYIAATDKSISASAQTEVPDDTRLSITNSDNPEAYPISTMTWIVAYKEQSYNNRSLEEAKALTSLLSYIIGKEGQEYAVKTHYAPLSDKLIEKSRAVINSMTFNGQPINSKTNER